MTNRALDEHRGGSPERTGGISLLRAGTGGAASVAALLLLAGCAGPAAVEDSPAASDPGTTSERSEEGGSGGSAGPTAEESLIDASVDVSWEDAVAAAQEAFDGRLISVELDRDRGELVYSVELVSDTEEYEAIVSASSGEIVHEQREPLDADDAAEAEEEVLDTSGLISPEEAMTAATGEIDGPVKSWKLDRDWQGTFFEVEIAASGNDRDVLVDAVSGEVVEVDD
ncbi:PepSY domain-containing protein [Leucobacter tenebrionis]|uniref:PepSY domain-containing protein n=1 Tax=Leucobacter tenebrionis TaxID=2873270 RepID=UPI001CA66B52|nr:PepSY domain-containing protein [Leucobacter tenebrionis]QZY52395.1 PepSY domain-containing protein [Leucobacter tenebrionis]